MAMQFKKVAIISGMLLSVAAISLPAFAAEAMVGTGGYARELRSMKMMKVMDADGNHEVTREEFLTHHKNVFGMQDKSGDQQIDAQEWVAKIVGGK